MYYYNFEALLLLCVQLLTAGNFFDKLLHYNSVIIISLARCHFNMIIAAKDYAFHYGGTSWTGLELFMFTLDFVDCIGLVQFMQ